MNAPTVTQADIDAINEAMDDYSLRLCTRYPASEALTIEKAQMILDELALLDGASYVLYRLPARAQRRVLGDDTSTWLRWGHMMWTKAFAEHFQLADKREFERHWGPSSVRAPESWR